MKRTSNLPPFALPPRAGETGYTLVEVAVAAALVAVFLAGIFDISSRIFRITRAGQETVYASSILAERLEQIRNCTWTQTTSRDYIRNTVISSAPSSTLPAAAETIRISAHPAGTPWMEIQRQGSATPITLGNALTLSQEALVRVDVRVNWQTTFGKRARMRETSLIISRGSS